MTFSLLTDEIFEDQVPANDKSDKFTHCYVAVWNWTLIYYSHLGNDLKLIGFLLCILLPVNVG